MVSNADDSGSCGTNVTYSYTESNHTLVISGSGNMTDYHYNGHPWYSYRESIQNIIIESGVTTIGNYAFEVCSSLTSITIPNSVTTIGDNAFSFSGLTSVTIPNSVTTIGINAFSGSGLTSITIPNSVTSIGWAAFNGSSDLESVTIGNSVTSIDGSTFAYCSGLTSITIPNSVTSIGGSAFINCSALESVSIPNSVTIIDDNAFYGTAWYNNKPDGLVYAGKVAYKYKGTMPANTSITIEEGTLGISPSAFLGCSGLTSITIPNSVTRISSNAFAYCSGLTSITIPNSVTSIGSYAFSNCSGLTSVTIPNSVTTIGQWAFNGCSGLTSVTVDINTPLTITENTFSNRANATLYIPAGSKTAYQAADYWKDFKEIIEVGAFIAFADANVKAICIAHWDTNSDGELSYDEAAAVTDLGSVFYNNTEITSFNELQYFTGLTGIGSSAFYNCRGLTSVTIPNSVTSIGDDAFQGCYHLTSIIIPNSVTNIGERAFSGCTRLTSINVDANNPKYDSRGNCNAIIETATNTLVIGCKTTVIPNSVTSIGDYAFHHNYSLTSIVIPNSVTSIGDYAFYYSGFTSFVIPNSVTSIGDYAFYDSRSLTSITIGNGVTSIGMNAFMHCNDLTSIEIPNSVISIGQGAFAHCYALTSVTIPNNGISIGSVAFMTCNHLTSIEIPNNVTSIGEGAFANCSSLTSVTIDNNSIMSGGGKLKDIFGEQVQSYIIGNNVISIGNTAFLGCTSLTSVEIPNSVTSIGGSSFGGCSGLTSIEIPNSVTSIGDFAFYNCSGLTSIVIPNSVTSIGDYTFGGCSGLTSIVIPNSVTSIGQNAFEDCSALNSITIPNSVTSIGQNAFYDCSGLTSVTVNINTPLTITSNTFSNRANATLNVPAGSKAAYQAANYWKEFKEIVEMADPNIAFADANVKAICIAHWDTNSDGELSYDEAAAVSDLGVVFTHNTEITSFNELQYFTGLTSIGQMAFYNCSGLTSITIPNSVTSIGTVAFQSCSNLSSITIPNSVTSIGTEAFSGCSGLSSITIPNSVTSIGQMAFYNCSGLTSITIPNSVTSIGGSAFRRCSGLTSIVVEDGNTIYDSRGNCNAIIETNTNKLITGCKNTIIPNNVTVIESYAFHNCTGLTSIEIPNSVTYFGAEGVFEGCSGLTSVTIGNGLTGIGYGAFSNCSGLTSIIIPNSVTSILSHAFDGCSSLTSVTVNINTPLTITSNTFSNRANATLYVPKGSKAAYQAADYWKEFKEIIEISLPTHKLIYVVDGEEYKTYDIEEGDPITPEAEPTKETYMFSGWSEIPSTMPTHDVTVTGTFERHFTVEHLVKVIGFIMNSNATPEDLALYDVNNDSELNIGDIILIVKNILNQEPVSGARLADRRASTIVDFTQYTAAQFELKVENNAAVKDIRLVSSMAQTHRLMYQQKDANTYNVVIFSMSNLLMKPKKGCIVEIDGGDAVMQNILVATPLGETSFYQNSDMPTGISQQENSEKPSTVYDLKGNRQNGMEGLRKGIYIINGKKVVVR